MQTLRFGNVTGSNAVNVFLGIGVAWSISAIYWEVKGQVFHVDPGSLAFSVTLFTIFAFINMGVLMLRRRPSVGGELGGPQNAEGSDFTIVPRFVASLHHILQPRGLLSHHRLLRRERQNNQTYTCTNGIRMKLVKWELSFERNTQYCIFHGNM